jgi:drug/metabolite transporter (DMT)-like permease
VELFILSLDVMLVVLIGAAFHASWNALVKSGSDPFLSTVLITTCVAGVTAVALIFLPLPQPESWSCLAASVLIHLVYFGLLVLAYRGGDLSLVYPIMRGTAPAFTALLAAAWLDEWASWGVWTGVFLVSGGVLLLAADSPRSKGVRLAPVVFALLNAAVIVGYTLVDGVGARLSGNAFSYTGWMLLMTGVLVFAISIAFRGRHVVRYVLAQWKKGTLGGACTFASYSLALWAMTKAPIAPVAALRETSIIFSTLLAVFFLKEKISPLRYGSVALVSMGAIAIKVF